MIHVEHLTKYYGDYPAVRDVSFDVTRGQVVGFLGPNGAGKSTTMRILAGYLGASSGTVSVDGLDVFWRPIEVRRKIGYMPENCPLYPDLRVEEYLRFRAGIKGLHFGRRRSRVSYVLGKCWLTDVRRQLIGTLSKGYRQRVGLADALLADPPVLILDEPTSGLDPSQIRAARDLVRELGTQHTVLLSTHILSEVEMTCGHVIIINQGTVAAAGAIADLERQAGEQAVVLAETAGKVEPGAVRLLDVVTDVQTEETTTGTRMTIHTSSPDELSARLCRLAADKGWVFRELRPRKQTLEELFVRITGEQGPVGAGREAGDAAKVAG